MPCPRHFRNGSRRRRNSEERTRMQSTWTDRDADAAVVRYQNLGRDLSLRVYTTRLLGQDPRLVLHGGGNTSVKTRITDLNGDEVDVLCVKGSGWDMGTIEPAGLPSVRLAPLLKLRAREKSEERRVGKECRSRWS